MNDSALIPDDDAIEASRARWVLVGLVLLASVPAYFSLAPVSSWLTRSVFRLSAETRLGAAVQFFVYEVPKVLILLMGVVFVVGILRTFVTPERARRTLAGRREGSANILGALFGVATPFCSCSAIPLFIGFVTAGVPLGVTFSFLIAAPMVNEIALALLFELFGWKVALIYLSTGLAIAVLSGWVIGRMKLERYVESWVWELESGEGEGGAKLTWTDRVDAGGAAVREIVGKVWIFVVIGIAVGAGIHGFVPTDFMARFMGRDAWWAVPAAVLLGVPMYSNAAGIIPIVQALLGKGAALGTALAFMMSVIALSLPEMIILRKVLRPTLIATFIVVVASGILIVGLLFNVIF